MRNPFLNSIASCLLLAVFACNSDDEDQPALLTSMDRDKFLGNWAGSYQCADPMADTLLIFEGSGISDFKVVLHAQAFNADTLFGELSGVNTIKIPEQEIAFAPGSGEINYESGKLSLSQSGFGITCLGSNYSKY